MATVGLQTLAIDQSIQVDTNNRTMLLLKSGQFTTTNNTGPNGPWYQAQADIDYRMTTAALMCIRAPSPGLALTVGTTRGARKLMNFRYLKALNVTFQYYIFDNLAPNNSATYGLQSFDANGQLIYDALDFPMKILNFNDINQPLRAQHRATYTAPHGNIAVGCTGGGSQISSSDLYAYTWNTYHYINGSSVIQWDNYDEDPDGQGIVIGAFGTSGGSRIVVDTTNIPLNYVRP